MTLKDRMKKERVTALSFFVGDNVKDELRGIERSIEAKYTELMDVQQDVQREIEYFDTLETRSDEVLERFEQTIDKYTSESQMALQTALNGLDLSIIKNLEKNSKVYRNKDGIDLVVVRKDIFDYIFNWFKQLLDKVLKVEKQARSVLAEMKSLKNQSDKTKSQAIKDRDIER